MSNKKLKVVPVNFSLGIYFTKTVRTTADSRLAASYSYLKGMWWKLFVQQLTLD